MGDKALLCVGGPLDGVRRVCKDRRLNFQVATCQPLPVVVTDEMLLPNTVETIWYVADFIRDKDGEVWFYRPSEQSQTETVRKLLGCYERSSNLYWGD